MKKESISIESNWSMMFKQSIERVQRHVATADGQDLIVEMLRFGDRLYKSNNNLEPTRLDLESYAKGSTVTNSTQEVNNIDTYISNDK
jgi:hypothetical protein